MYIEQIPAAFASRLATVESSRIMETLLRDENILMI